MIRIIIGIIILGINGYLTHLNFHYNELGMEIIIGGLIFWSIIACLFIYYGYRGIRQKRNEKKTL